MELKIEYIAVNKLKPYEKNTRKHEKKMLTISQSPLKNMGCATQ